MSVETSEYYYHGRLTPWYEPQDILIKGLRAVGVRGQSLEAR